MPSVTRSHTTFNLIAHCFLVLLVGVLATACAKPKPPTILRFVVPDGFRGAIKITPQPAPARAQTLQEGAINIVNVPPEGVVHMKSTREFILAYDVECVTKSGTRIPYAKPASVPRELSIFPIYSETGKDMYFLVGYYRERDQVWSDGKDLIKPGQQVLPDNVARGE